jgi:AraC-like DNA-binding protein
LSFINSTAIHTFMNFRLIDILIVLAIFQLLVFAFALQMRKSTRQLNQLYLSLFFFSLASNILNFLLFRKTDFFITSWTVHLFYLGSPFAFVYAPAFYLYLRTFAAGQIHNAKRASAHFIPFVVYMVYILLAFLPLTTDEKRTLLQHGGLLSPALYQFLIISLHIQVLVYVVLSLHQILRFRNRLKDQFASADKLNFSWISSISGVILCLWLLDLLRFFASYFLENIRNSLEIALFTGFLIFCNFFLFKAWSYRFISIEEDVRNDGKKLSLSELIRTKYQQQLIQFMTEHKPFLDPEITLTELANRVHIPPRSLSEVINISFGQNFYDFINTFRIRESQRLIATDDDPDKTILEVLFEVGFNSKSSFNTAFKKHTGMTPTEYRRNQRFSDMPQKQAG